VSAVAVGVRYKLLVMVSLVAAFVAVPVTHSLAARAAGSNTPPTNPVLGKRLFRELCSQCHAVTAAGVASSDGAGQSRGPSFNDVRISFTFAVAAIEERGPLGHELALHRMTFPDVYDVAAWLVAATKDNSDGCSDLATACERAESPWGEG
jgi:mono/diheme cytochrome c family protein